MAFFGKNFKKVKFENIEEFFDAHNAPEKYRSSIKDTDTLTRIEKNADGTIQYIVTKGGAEKTNMKITPNVETDFVTPEGAKTKMNSQLNGDKLHTAITLPDGAKFHIEMVYENNTLKQTFHKDNKDIKGAVIYEAV